MSVETRADKVWNRVIAACAGVVVLTLAITGVIVLGGLGKTTYSQATPDDLVKSAVLMVKNGDAKRLPDLIHADSEEMRNTLKNFGIVLGHLQKLATAIRDKYPEEIARYRQEADEAIAKGKPPAFVGSLVEQMSGRDGPPSDDEEEAIRDLVARIFADPYGWIEQNEGRLSTVEVADDMASVLVDGKPAAGVGIALKKDGDKWYVALPTNLPPVTRIMPKAPGQWRMINSLLKILDNTVLELTDDVNNGRMGNLKSIADKAQEKVLFPGGLWFAAYAADMDARRRIDRNLRQYRERQKAWATARAGTARGGVSEKVLGALSKIASIEVDPLVRSRKQIQWEGMPEGEFESTVREWAAKHDLQVDLAGALSGDEVELIITQWDEGAGREMMKKRK